MDEDIDLREIEALDKLRAKQEIYKKRGKRKRELFNKNRERKKTFDKTK